MWKTLKEKNNDTKKVTVIPSVIGVLGKVTKGFIKELEELDIRTQVETIKTTTLLARILRGALETWAKKISSDTSL